MCTHASLTFALRIELYIPILKNTHTNAHTIIHACIKTLTGGLCANGSLSIIVEPIPHAPITPSPSYQHNGTVRTRIPSHVCACVICIVYTTEGVLV